MVNTRRMESRGKHHHHHTRGSAKVKIEQESGSSSLKDSDSSNSDGSSFDTPLKPKEPIKKKEPPKTTNVLEIRTKFERKFNARPLATTHKRISIDERRSLAVYSRKMDDDSELENGNYSEEELYSRGYQTRHIIKRNNRILRRTALSLRPIRQKCYTDPHSPIYFDSEGNGGGLRRSKRKGKNISWLTDNQMHKVGYPNLNVGYSEEDSRDAVDAHEDLSVTRRTTRHSNRRSTGYYYDDYVDIPEPRRRRRRVIKKVIRTQRESESKEDKAQTNVNGRSAKPKKEPNDDDEDADEEVEESPKEVAGTSRKMSDANQELKKENGVPEKKVQNCSAPKQDVSSESEEEEELPRTRHATRPTRTANVNNLMNQRSSRDVPRKKIMDSSSESEEEARKYSLRDRPPKPAPKAMQTSVLRTERRELRRSRWTRRRKVSSSSSDSSSSSSDRVCHGKPQPRAKKTDKMKSLKNFSKNPKSPHSKNEKMKSGAGGSSKIIPLKPETLDASVRFNSVGGLEGHIQCLKEMILLPMMYPEVFRQFQVQPPRGVLFHGPPGTGKTLIARALANECSFGTRKVSFFMRKGADLLSKWIGESEKQLRLLFEQAAELKPSIIFFDELDGLAPVRSSRQDQVHASIVSTLLALMDGLDNRGEVIVIGATNRIDAIDPALRRPGRFDRELFFPLPSRKERGEILNVHVAQWSHPPSQSLLDYLAENSVGYCGSDLRALCSEAVIQSFRRTYPQVYGSEHRLLLDPENVKVEKVDFLRAKSLLVPASHRITQGLGRKLMPILEPIFQNIIKRALTILEQSFPHGLNVSLSKVKLSPNVRPAQLILTGDGPQHGQTSYLAPAVLFKMEHIHSYLLDLASLFKETGRSPEEACIQVFNEARRNVPSIIYIPSIDRLWGLVSETMRAILLSQVTQLDPNIPILLFSTAETAYKNLPPQLQNLFSSYRKETIEVKSSNAEVRKQFFKPLLIDSCLKPPRITRDRPKTPPPLPRANTPPPTPLTEDQAKKLYEAEEHTLRELRIFLRDMCKKLANNKLFFMFTKPVDTEEVPDYTNIIKQPMDLETMMTKVDFHRYECAKDFLSDIELIVQNALEYNPARTSADKQIRHRACSLRDYAYTLIKTEMDSDFEEKCQSIKKKRVDRKASTTQYLPAYINTPEASLLDNRYSNGNDDNRTAASEKISTSERNGGPTNRITPVRKRKLSWQKGCLKKRKKSRLNGSQNSVETNMKDDKISSDDSKENEPESSTAGLENKGSLRQHSDSQSKIDVNESLKRNCDTQRMDVTTASQLHSPRRKLSDLMSPSELLDNPLEFDDVDQALNETVGEQTRSPVECSEGNLENILDQAVKVTEDLSLLSLLDLHNQLNRIIKKYSRTHIRNTLPKELSKELARFKKLAETPQ